jgi:thiol-disulfide isomerase/thioredoxin
MTTKRADIIEFYGETCPHCLAMKPIVEKLEKDLDIEITKLEVWNNTDNQATMQKYEDIIGEACGGFAGVPAFVNTKTGQALCGAHDAADITNLINGGDCSGNVCKPHSKMPKGGNK